VRWVVGNMGIKNPHYFYLIGSHLFWGFINVRLMEYRISLRNFGMHIFFSLQIQNCSLLGHDKPVMVKKTYGT